jgi:hypothetical protein
MGVCITGASGVGSNISLINLKIHDVRMSGIYAEMTSNLLIDGCAVYNTNSLYLSDEQVSIIGVNNFEIKNCLFHDSITENGLDCKDGSSNGSIHNNEIYGSNDTTTGIYLECGGTAEDNFKIYNNRIHDCTDPGIVLNSEDAP